MYKNRRNKLMQQLPDQCIALFFSGKAPYKVGDEKYAFSVERNFYYFTGLDAENMILALVKTTNAIYEYMFIERYDEEMAKWVGGRLLPEQVQAISNINDIFWQEETMETISNCLSSYFDDCLNVPVFADFTKQEAYQSSMSTLFIKELLLLHPQIQPQNVASYTTKLRCIKEEDEIMKLKQAIQVTKQGIACMMSNAQANMMEYELEAYFDFVLKTKNCEHAFPSIIASGKQATILHYCENNKKIKNNALVLCDLGAAYAYMNADITRTFPINGKFTKRQRQIYDIVLEGNKHIIHMIRPGIALQALNEELILFYQKKLKEIGLIKHGKSVHDYYWHGVSHMLGLETHDVFLRNTILQAGHVLTVEPGLYIEEEHIGIRIEDDILVTQDGCINLSADIMKEADEIEAFMETHRV